MSAIALNTSKAGDFSLPGVDGKIHSLKDYADKKALLVIFSCNHCPYVQANEDRIKEIQKDYGSRGVQVLAINSNDSVKYPDDSFEEMKKRAKERNFNFPYLRDESQEVAKAYGATHTPHLFLFDEFRNLRYTGKIDDDWKEPKNVTRRFLREALDAVLAGKVPAEQETYAIGCTIKWK